MDAVFKRVASHLKRLGIRAKLIKFPPSDVHSIRKAEQKLDLTLPDALKDLYLHYGDGFLFCWFHKEDSGFVQVPNLKDLVKQYRGWKELVLWMDDYDFPHVKDRALARKTYQRMKFWLPLRNEGNGDCFCLDCNSRRGAVVFDQHDWYDGGSGENGHLFAPDLRKFIENWAQVCFTSPKGRFWSPAFTRRGVSWTQRHFKKQYIIPM